jgi:phospholipase/carboxylesterase
MNNVSSNDPQPLTYLSHLTAAASASGRVDAAVVWLHGLGADGHDFAPIVPELQRCNELAIRFVFPHAPVQPVTINGGMRMRAWYDIRSVDLAGTRELDRSGIQASCAQVTSLIRHLQREHNLRSSQVVLAGFSQGGVIALLAGLEPANFTPAPLGGIIALSCYLPWLPEGLAAATAVKQTPLFMAHGNADAMVPFQLGQQAADDLQQQGLPVSWHSYSVGHGVLPQELADIDAWLATCLADGTPASS